ncbi:MAG TPA: hypothetical protein VEY09_04945 [Pyrinomonadaceae bacterium]|nr:hypothetical protein [Pyrinomonadaceae bacterium]
MSLLIRRLCGSALALGFAALLAFGSALDAQGQGRRGSRVWDRNDRHDRGRHLGWERGRRVGHRRRAERRDRRDRREWRRDRRDWRRDRRELRRDRRQDRRERRREWRRDRRDS